MSNRVRSLVWALSAPLISGLAVALAFPHFDVWPLAWVAYVPLLLVIEQASLRRAFLLAWLAGTTANFVGFFWMSDMLFNFGHLPYPVSVALTLVGASWQGLPIALAFWLSLLLARRSDRRPWLFLPLAYTFFEFLHPILFPWFLGNCQYERLLLIQACDLFGVSFLTFLLVMANAVLYEVVRAALARRAGGPSPVKPLLAPVATLLGVLSATLLYGTVRFDQVDRTEKQAETLRLGIVEPEIPIFEEQLRDFPKGESPLWVLKWNTLNLHAASVRLAEEAKPDLLVWPESTYFPALSVYARRAPVDFVTLAGSKVLLHAPSSASTASPTVLEAGIRLTAVASRGDGRTFVAGHDGAIFSVTPQGLAREKSPVTTPLRTLWYGCQGTAAYLDTPEDQCLPMAAGDNGTLLARSNDGWIKLKTDATENLAALTGFAPGRYVAAGDGVILAGNVKDGVTSRQATDGVSWVAATGTEQTVLLVSSAGAIARVTAEGEIEVSDKTLDVQGTVRAIALLPDGALLVATSRELRRVAGVADATPLHRGPIHSVSCDSDGRCLALEAGGRIIEVLPEGQAAALSGHAADGSGASAIALWPFSRYYWWLPADTAQIYKARLPAPGKPEYPAAVIEDLGQPDRIPNAVQRGFGVPLLFGATSGTVQEIEDPNSLSNTRYNSAFLADGAGNVLGRYDKQYLLAFGEYIPFGDWFPVLYEWSPESGRFLPGPAREPIPFLGHRLGVLICYEDIIPSHTNAVASSGAEALVNLTNDAWFGKTKEAWQHFVLASFRAVEQRLPLVRATTTGISGFVSATGEIRHMTDPEGAESFIVDLPLLKDSWTLYRAGGRHFPWMAGLLLTILAVMILSKKRPVPVSDNRTAQKRSASARPSRRSRS